MFTTPPNPQVKTNGFRNRFKNITVAEEQKVYEHQRARFKLYAVRPKRVTGKMADERKIYWHQRARLNIPNDVPNEVIGLKAILEGHNLVNLVQQGKLKVICYAQSKDEIKIHITNCQTAMVKAKLQAGQFFLSKSSSNQYLVARRDYEWQIPLGQCVQTCETFCFDGELSSPSKDDQYLIGSVKSGFYQQGMNQFEVWQLKFKMQSKAEDFKSEDMDLIAMKKSDIKMMMTKWGDELAQW